MCKIMSQKIQEQVFVTRKTGETQGGDGLLHFDAILYFHLFIGSQMEVCMSGRVHVTKNKQHGY